VCTGNEAYIQDSDLYGLESEVANGIRGGQQRFSGFSQLMESWWQNKAHASKELLVEGIKGKRTNQSHLDSGKGQHGRHAYQKFK